MPPLVPLPLQNFCVILNQHNPSRDKAVHFLVTLKRPDQRNLELQRRVSIIKPEALHRVHTAGIQWSQEASPAWGLWCPTIRGIERATHQLRTEAEPCPPVGCHCQLLPDSP